MMASQQQGASAAAAHLEALQQQATFLAQLHLLNGANGENQFLLGQWNEDDSPAPDDAAAAAANDTANSNADDAIFDDFDFTDF